MSHTGIKLHPSIAKYTDNGQINCLLCKMQVKPKVWTAHVSGRTHKNNADRLKQQLTAPPKRISENPSASVGPPIKRAKEDVSESNVANDGPLPSDFFDEDPGLNIQTPWQKARDDEKEHSKEKKGVIEGVPHGFFDDKKLDGRVRETVEKNAQMDEEYDKLMREVNEQQAEEEIKADEEFMKESARVDIDRIDEQMERYQLVNVIDRTLQKRLEEARARAKKQEEDSDDSDLGEYDFDNWRAKKIL